METREMTETVCLSLSLSLFIRQGRRRTVFARLILLSPRDDGSRMGESPETLAALRQPRRDTRNLRLQIRGAIAALAREAVLDFLILARIGTGIGFGLGPGLVLGLAYDEAHRCLRHLDAVNGPGQVDLGGTTCDLLAEYRRRSERVLRGRLVTFKNTCSDVTRSGVTRILISIVARKRKKFV